jgi:hypothetical protein
VETILRTRRWLADHGRPAVPITICGAGRDKETLAAYAEAGVDEVALRLPTLPESATKRELDELADVAESLVIGEA